MKLSALTSLFVAALVYTISVVIGLINGFPLYQVFLNGILFTIITAIMVWVIVYSLEFLAGKNKEEKADDNKNTESRDTKESSNNEGQLRVVKDNVNDNSSNVSEGNEEELSRRAEDFSPLTPPVLEVNQQGVERGEDN